MTNPCSWKNAIHSFALCVIAAGSMMLPAKGESSAEASKIAQLERQVELLNKNYILARQDADEARAREAELRERYDALGGAALGQTEQRIIDVVAQYEAKNSQLENLRTQISRVMEVIENYSKSALVEDAKVALELEVSLRELELALGYRHAPSSQLEGNLNHSQVVSIDSESGLIVINAGKAAKVKVGMPMEIARGDQAIAYAIVTDVREKVAGLLIQKRLSNSLSVKVGDAVSVKTIQ